MNYPTDPIQNSADSIFMLDCALWQMSALQCDDDYHSQYAIDAHLIGRSDYDETIIRDTLLSNLRSFQETWESVSQTTPWIYQSEQIDLAKEVRDVLQRIRDLTGYELGQKGTEQPECQGLASRGECDDDSETAAAEITLASQTDKSDSGKSVAEPSQGGIKPSVNSQQDEYLAVAIQSTPDRLYMQDSPRSEEGTSFYHGRIKENTCAALLSLAATGIGLYGLEKTYRWLTQPTDGD